MILFLLLSALVMRGGIKQRLRVDEATEAPPAAETTVRGGLRQRFCSASSSSTAPRAKTAPHYAKRRKLEAEPEDVSNLPLTTSLRRDWARGILPSNKVLEYAAGAASQGARGLEKFAGGDNNAHRRVVAALGYPEKAPRLSWIEIPVAGGGVKPQPILCPIDTLEALLKDPVRFQEHMRGEDLNVEDLWYSLSGTKVFTANKMHINVTRSLAITLHGDGAPTTKADGLFTISWSSLHASGSTRHTKNIFTVVRKKDMGPGTLDAVTGKASHAPAMAGRLQMDGVWLQSCYEATGSFLLRSATSLRGRVCRICVGCVTRVHILGHWFGRTDWPLQDGGPLCGLMSNMSQSFWQME